jgi:mono/diheme cytochrome c family protein
MKPLRLLIVVPVLACSFAASSVAAERPMGGEPAPKPNPVTLARGKYLVTLGGCHDCHTPKLMTEKGPALDAKRILSGFPSSEKAPAVPGGVLGPKSWGGLFTNDQTGWAGPWGISFASNLTPDKGTGIGAWTEETFIKTLRTGKTPGGRPILPPMPWESIQKASDKDLKAIFAYLMSLPPVPNMVPSPVPPK